MNYDDQKRCSFFKQLTIINLTHFTLKAIGNEGIFINEKGDIIKSLDSNVLFEKFKFMIIQNFRNHNAAFEVEKVFNAYEN